MNALSCSGIIYKSSGSSSIDVFAAPATCSLPFPLHFGLLTVNAAFALDPVHCIARGAGDEVVEFPLVFLHVPCRGIACGGRMGSLSPAPSAALSRWIYLPVTMLFIGYSWRARHGNSPWVCASDSVSSVLSARSSTSSSDSSSQLFLAASGFFVGFSLGCEYQHKNELKLSLDHQST